MIHFFDPSNEKIVSKLEGIAEKSDIVLSNLEDAIPVDNKEAARARAWSRSARPRIWARPSSGRASTRSTPPGSSMT